MNMQKTIYAVYDTAILTWLTPFFAHDKRDVIESFTHEVNSNTQSKFYKHPTDFTLFELGVWDDDKCEFKLHLSPVRVVMAIELKTSTIQQTTELTQIETKGE